MGFGFSRSLTIDHTKCGTADSSSFPVLVFASDASLKDVAHGGHVQSSTGADLLLFSDAAGVTQLASEIDTYDNVNGVLTAWVQVPTVSHTADTTIYLFYGNAAPPARAANPWDANYKAVWHLGSGTALALADSSSSGNTLTNHGATPTVGEISGGAAFNGTTQSAVTGAVVNPGAVNTISVECWFKATSYANTPIILENSANYNNVANAWLFSVNSLTALAFQCHTTAGHYFVRTFTAPSSAAWHHYLLVIDTQSGANFVAYVDGVSVALTNADVSPLAGGNCASDVVNLMARNTAQFFMPGALDELRISNTPRSASWATASFNNQSAPGSIGAPGFLAWGAELALSGLLTLGLLGVGQ